MRTTWQYMGGFEDKRSAQDWAAGVADWKRWEEGGPAPHFAYRESAYGWSALITYPDTPEPREIPFQ